MHLKIYKTVVVHFKDINVFRVAHSFGLGLEVCYPTRTRGSRNTFGFGSGFGLMFNG